MPRVLARVVLGVVAVAIVVGAVAEGPRAARHVWHSFTTVPTSPKRASADPTARLDSLAGTRYQIWKVTLHAFDAHPANGSGAGTTRFFWEKHATTDESIHDAHNIWLQNMGELGVPGLLLIVGIAVASLAVAFQVRRRGRRSLTAGASAALLAAFVVYLVAASVDWMWESTAVTVLALAGVSVTGARLAAARRRLNVPVRIAVVAVALAAGVAQLPAC